MVVQLNDSIGTKSYYLVQIRHDTPLIDCRGAPINPKPGLRCQRVANSDLPGVHPDPGVCRHSRLHTGTQGGPYG